MRRGRGASAEHDERRDDERNDTHTEQDWAPGQGIQRHPPPGSVHSAHPALSARRKPGCRPGKSGKSNQQRMGDIVKIGVEVERSCRAKPMSTSSKSDLKPGVGWRAMTTDLHTLLGDDADALLGYTAKAFPREGLTLPGPDYLADVFANSDRSPNVLRNLGTVFNHGRLAGTGYISILPVDQGIEHSAAASFSKNPAYFDPLNLLELALAGECSAVATTLGTLGLASRKYVHKIPFIVKLNHNAFLHVPDTYDQIMFGSVRQAFDLGAVGVGATIYFGSDDMDRELQQVRDAFAEAHELGMFTVLWCYLRNSAFKT